ncbi:hypothetical protein GOBAR_AA39326 [Gossypium barbadense]|uniref:Uncharacterized protein n=1 Tax=Gossypium barbadense TaxID=3634 RepID=A0A2P5VRB4_GOSBA|nr:hypothetical protein GOBAR_AA39326 [Gossypium barbadense]
MSLGTTTYVPVIRSCTIGETRLHPEPATGVSLASPNVGIEPHDSSAMCSAPQLNSRTVVREEDFSTAATSLEHVPVPTVSTTNTHAMVTRSKAEILKT